jgi:uncharacterized protein YhhL (DUF1145 family)
MDITLTLSSVRNKRATTKPCQRKTRNTITIKTAGNCIPVSHGTRKSGAPTKLWRCKTEDIIGHDPHKQQKYFPINIEFSIIIIIITVIHICHSTEIYVFKSLNQNVGKLRTTWDRLRSIFPFLTLSAFRNTTTYVSRNMTA